MHFVVIGLKPEISAGIRVGKSHMGFLSCPAWEKKSEYFREVSLASRSCFVLCKDIADPRVSAQGCRRHRSWASALSLPREKVVMDAFGTGVRVC